MTPIQDMTKAETAKLIALFAGCPQCHRFNYLSVTDTSTADRGGLFRFSCGHCSYSFNVPIRTLAEAKAEAAAVSQGV